MNKLAQAMQKESNYSYTDNGALTHASSLDACLDFFFVGPVAKKKPADAVEAFKRAYATNRDVALRILQWLRDARGGAGARQAFRDCFAWLMDHKASDAIAVLDKVPAIGRWDDTLVGLFSSNRDVQDHVIDMIRDALLAENGLAAKWLPRKGPMAAAIRSQLGLSPKDYRKTIVELSKTVEQQMCANEWDQINYSHVPSVAFARYKNAFKKHDHDRFAKFANDANNGKAKINTSVVYPHDVIRNLPVSWHSSTRIDEVTRSAIDAQWKQLPNYIDGKDTGLVIADVSGSMASNVSGSVTALHICIALAMYMAERARGPFKDTFLTFTNSAELQKLTGDSITNRYSQLLTADWHGSTNLQSAVDLVLNTAVKHNVSPDDMPKSLIIISDMEFNSCVNGTNLDTIKKKYADAGYDFPSIVFWNVNGRLGNVPATYDENNVALISGYSPAIMKTVFKASRINPVDIMLDTVMVERYDLPLE